MSKPNEMQQQWIDRNPCVMCGKPLNKPFGRKCKYAQYITIESRSSGGSPSTHKMRNALPRKMHIGLCCIDKLTQGVNN